jgi:hypothetical protein
LHRAILYCPFVPFSILFTRAVQLSDIADLCRLERFAASLQPPPTLIETITHPYRLYKLLCQATRLYFDLDTPTHIEQGTFVPDLSNSWTEFDFTQSSMEGGPTEDEIFRVDDAQMRGLYDWSYDSQKIIGLLSEDIMF